MQRLKIVGLSLAALMIIGVAGAGNALAAGPPVNIQKPTMLPIPKVGVTVHGTQGGWTENPTSYAYRWLRCNAAGAECIEIAGATAQTYVVVEADRNHSLIVKVTASNAAGEASALSAPYGVEVTPAAPEIIPNPTASKPLAFSGKGRTTFVEAAPLIECVESIHGEFISANWAKRITINYTECSSRKGPYTTELLEGRLGYLNKSTHVVGLQLFPEKAGSNLWIPNFFLRGDNLTGSVIGSIGPVNTPTSSLGLSWAESNGHQQYLGFEGQSGGEQLMLQGCLGGPCPITLLDHPTLELNRSAEIHTS